MRSKNITWAYLLGVLPFFWTFFSKYRSGNPFSDYLIRRRIIYLVSSFIVVLLIFIAASLYIKFANVGNKSDLLFSPAANVYFNAISYAFVPAFFYFHFMILMGRVMGALVLNLQIFLEDLTHKMKPFAGPL